MSECIGCGEPILRLGARDTSTADVCDTCLFEGLDDDIDDPYSDQTDDEDEYDYF